MNLVRHANKLRATLNVASLRSLACVASGRKASTSLPASWSVIKGPPVPLAPRSRGCGTPPASCCRVVSQWRQKAVYRAVSCTGLKIACVFRKGVDRVFVDHALFLERVRQAFSAMKRASARASKNDSTPLNPIMCVSHHYTATRCRTVIEIPSTVLHRAVPRPHRAQRNLHGTRAGRRCRHGACARARAPAARTRGRIPSSDLHSGLRQRAFCQRCSITASQARAHMNANMLHLSPNRHQCRQCTHKHVRGRFSNDN